MMAWEGFDELVGRGRGERRRRKQRHLRSEDRNLSCPNWRRKHRSHLLMVVVVVLVVVHGEGERVVLDGGTVPPMIFSAACAAGRARAFFWSAPPPGGDIRARQLLEVALAAWRGQREGRVWEQGVGSRGGGADAVGWGAGRWCVRRVLECVGGEIKGFEEGVSETV